MVTLQFFLFFHSTFSFQLQIFTSVQSDLILVGVLTQYLQQSHHEVSMVPITSSNSLSTVDGSQIDFALDLTSTLLYLKPISDYCDIFQIVVLGFDPRNFLNSFWSFCVHSSYTFHSSSLLLLANHLQWFNPALVSQIDPFSIQIAEEVLQEGHLAYHSFMSVSSSTDNINNLVNRELKTGGFKQIMVVGQGEFVDEIVKSMQANSMYYYSGVLISSTGIWSHYNEKSVVVVEKGLESALASVQYEMLALGIFLNLISSKFGNRQIDGLSLQQYLESITLDHMKFPDFSIVNKANLTYQAIGTISAGKLVLLSQPVFILGNPDNYPATIRSSISMNNPPGFPNATVIPYFQSGGLLAVGLVDSTQTKLKNHLLVPFLASCGSEFFFEQLSVACWSQSYLGLGTFYLTSPVYAVTEGENEVFMSLGIKVPMIGGMDTSSPLSNRTAFPYFTRVVGSIDSAAYMTNVFKALNWNEFAVIYTNSTTYIEAHAGIVATGVLVTNALSLRMLPAGYNSSQFEQYKKVFEEVDRTKTRIIFVLSDSTEMFYIAEGFYKIGLRSGDLIGFFVQPVSSSVNDQMNATLKGEFIEVFQYSMILSGLEWVGDYGLSIKEMMIATIGNEVDYTCYSFDAMMLGINAVDYLLTSGQAYEDPDLLLNSIRMQRFTGCSGTIMISSDSNDRTNYNYAIFQLVYDNSSNSYQDVHVLTQNQQAVAPVIQVENFTWSSGTVIPPSNRLEGLSCPFEDREIQTNEGSRGLLYFFLLFFLIYTAGLAVGFWKKWGKKQVKQLDKPTSEKFGDYVVMLVVLVDMMQIIGMGPDLTPLIFGTNMVSAASSADFSNFISFQKNVYWAALYVTLIVVAVWIVLAGIVIGRFGEKYDVQVLKFGNKVGMALIPIVADLLFLPIISISLFIFDCQNGIGDMMTEAFMTKDCFTFCWESTHLTYAVLAMVGLIFYLPSAIFLRPLWQELESELNIQTNPVVYMLKSIIQMTVVLLNRTVKNSSQSLHGISIILLFIAFSLVILKSPPFNYLRSTLWKHLSHVAIVWSCLLSSIYWYFKTEPFVWTALIVIGWVLIIVFGILYQKKHYPNLLISEKPLDISALVKFTFSKSVKIESLPIKRMSTVNFASGTQYEVRADEENKVEVKRSSASLYQTGGFVQDVSR